MARTRQRSPADDALTRSARRTGFTRVLLGLALLLLVAACVPAPAADAESVVLVHGLGRTSRSLFLLETQLRLEGYRVVTYDYPSTTEPIEHLVDSLASVVNGCCAEDPDAVHFVTHSMGGVLVRSLLAGAAAGRPGRVVMLSPPSHGSEIIDAFSESPLLVSIVGPAGVRLGTDSSSVPGQLPPVDFPLGIIVGDRSLSRVGSWLIPGPDDGLVGVEQARLPGAADFLVLSASHTLIMNDPEAVNAVVSFLRTGRFGAVGR